MKSSIWKKYLCGVARMQEATHICIYRKKAQER